MIIEKLTKGTYDQILLSLEDFWGPRHLEVRAIHHPMFLYEFGDTAFVIRDGEKVTGYLWGFKAQTSATAYVHLIGIRESVRRSGVARKLFDFFVTEMKSRGCDQIKAITTATNIGSIQFHQSLGMSLLEVQDYRAPGESRVVFQMAI